MVSVEMMQGIGRRESAERVPDGGSGADSSCGPTVCQMPNNRGKYRDEYDRLSAHTFFHCLPCKTVGNGPSRERVSRAVSILHG